MDNHPIERWPPCARRLRPTSVEKRGELSLRRKSEISRLIPWFISFVNPRYLRRLDCSVVHGKLGGPGSCEANAVKRWIAAFRDCLLIYLPVSLSLHQLEQQPTDASLSIGPSHSTASLQPPWALEAPVGFHHSHPPRREPKLCLPRHFRRHHLRIVGRFQLSDLTPISLTLPLFLHSVCLVRTRIPLLLPNVNPQIWDSGLCTGLGCFLCGFRCARTGHRTRNLTICR
jgi:hypothetical protein